MHCVLPGARHEHPEHRERAGVEGRGHRLTLSGEESLGKDGRGNGRKATAMSWRRFKRSSTPSVRAMRPNMAWWLIQIAPMTVKLIA
jgi:hypothetical protein